MCSDLISRIKVQTTVFAKPKYNVIMTLLLSPHSSRLSEHTPIILHHISTSLLAFPLSDVCSDALRHLYMWLFRSSVFRKTHGADAQQGVRLYM